MKKIRLIIGLCVMSTFPISSYAQFWDSVVEGQFVTGEVGGLPDSPGLGGIDPIATTLYTFLYKSYMNEAAMTNKLTFRVKMMNSLMNETDHAEAIDSALTERGRIEFYGLNSNVLDRQPIVELTLSDDKSKIDSKLNVFKSNINRITYEGGTVKDLKAWTERYNAIQCGYTAVKDGYMSSGKRKEQYVAIYEDIIKQNKELVEYILYLRSLSNVKGWGDGSKIPKTKTGKIAKETLISWYASMASASELGREHETTGEDRLYNILYNK